MEMTWFDHLVVHTSDLGRDDAPISLHPNLPNRTGELLIRRQLIEKSLRLMQRVHLINVRDSDKGILFEASEDAPSFLALLKAPYSKALKQRAQWLAERFSRTSTAEIKALVEAKIGRWTAEFHVEKPSFMRLEDNGN
jgi:hypothetical protein